MSEVAPQPAVPEPERPGFQYSLTTLLLLFVVLGSSLAVFGAWGIVVFALTVGLAIYLHRVESLWSLTELALVVLCLMCLLTCLLLPAVQSAGRVARRAVCQNNLKQIALALLYYHQTNGCFPPAYLADKNGKPMHSWRVLILPYLEQNSLYEQYRFDEPWDGCSYKLMYGKLPESCMLPSSGAALDNLTDFGGAVHRQDPFSEISWRECDGGAHDSSGQRFNHHRGYLATERFHA